MDACYNRILMPFFLIWALCPTSSVAHFTTLETNYGFIDVCEPVILDLIKHPMMQRLKHIHQYGIEYYLANDYDYTRYEHSLGVFALLRIFKAPLAEQIAGLLHDASHTIFSHVGDHFFNYHTSRDSYQDHIHEWFLNISGLGRVLKMHGFKVKEVLHKNNNFQRLEQDLPDLCADRLEYILHGGLLEKILTQEDIDCLIQAIRFEGGVWFFTQQDAARKLGMTSLYLTERVFASREGMVAYIVMARLLHYAVEHKIITLDDIHFGYDDIVWEHLKSSQDPIIQSYFDKLYYLDKNYVVADGHDASAQHLWCKFRGIDPWVQTAHGLQRLTALDEEYRQEFMRSKKQVSTGCYVKFVECCD